MEEYTLKTKSREDFGRAASKRVRAGGLLPVNVYGHKEANRYLAVEYKEFEKFIVAGHRMLTVEFDGGSEHGVVKEIQYDGLGMRMIHVDIARVDRQERISMSVPVVTFGVAKGQSAGGTLDVALKELQVEGPASSIPESFEIKVADLEIEDSVRVKDITAPEGCEFQHDPEEVILAVHSKRVAEADEVAEAPAPSEPEVISKKKDGDEETES